MFFLFAVVWVTDILGYFVGRTVGGPRLALRISPKKTWSGAVGRCARRGRRGGGFCRADGLLDHRLAA